jgi:hypothetical protein
MMIKIKIAAYCIILLSFIFFLYPIEAPSMVSTDSENISDSTFSPYPEKIPDSIASPDSEEISDSTAAPASRKLSNPVVSSGSRKIPDSIVSLSSGYIIVVDKKYQKIYVFHKEETFSKVFEASCSTGKNSGSKRVAGDAKTPNGIFFYDENSAQSRSA